MGKTLFLSREDAVAVGIQPAHNRIVGLFSTAILENADVCRFRCGLANALSELYRAVVSIIRIYETAYEPDHDIGRSGRWIGAGNAAVYAVTGGDSQSHDYQRNERSSKWS